MFQAILGPVAKLASTWIEGRQKKAELKSKVELTKLEATKTRIEKEGTWDEKQADAAADSWKDEAWTLASISIIFASFVPSLQPYMKEGFIFLKNDCPDWLSWGILASIAGSFGLKSIAKFKK